MAVSRAPKKGTKAKAPVKKAEPVRDKTAWIISDPAPEPEPKPEEAKDDDKKDEGPTTNELLLEIRDELRAQRGGRG